MRRLALIAIAIVSASCNQQKKPPADDNYAVQFKRGFLSSCQTAAEKNVSADLARKYCGCGLDKVVAQFRPEEFATLNLDKVKPIMAQCAAEVGIK